MNKKVWLLLVVLLMAFNYGCAHPGKESFQLGQELAKTNRFEESVAMYEDALAKEPQNPEYLAALEKAKETVSAKHLGKAKAILAQTPLTYDRARAAYQEAEKAASLVPKSKEAANLVAQVGSELEKIGKKAETLYSEATKAIGRNEWVEAAKGLREIAAFYPNYLDVTLKPKQVEENGIAYYLKEAEKFEKTEEWDKVSKNLMRAQGLSPERAEIISALKEAQAKHHPDYYLKKAEEYAGKSEWDMATGFAKRALDVGLSENTKMRVAGIRQNAALYYLNQCEQSLSAKRLYTAYVNASKAVNYDPYIKAKQDTAKIIRQLFGTMAEKAASYETSGHIGNAWVWYEKIISIHPENQEAFFKAQALRDKIKERVVRKIAIMDFTFPSGNPDAGKIVTDTLLAYITAHAGSDMKILARDVLGAILKEIELGQAGLYDIESARKAGKLKGTDVFIFGSVLNFQVERNVSEGFKSENVVVGKKSSPNPAYQMWLMTLKGKATEKDMITAPPAIIEEPIRETVRYKVGTEKKRATVGVSFRVIDIEEGEVVTTKTIKKFHEVKDDYSEGVAFANIKYKPVELPADSELVEKVTQEVAAELGYEVLSRFQNPQTQYFNSAELLKRKREFERAIEKYVNVIFTEDLKNITGPLSESSRKEIEQLLKQIAL